MEIIMNYFKSKTIPFYIGLGFSLLSIIAGIVYGAGLSFLQEYVTPIVTALLIVGPIVFIICSIFGLDKVGMWLFTLISFAAFVVFIAYIYEYPIKSAMDTPDFTKLKGFGSIVCVAVFNLVCVIGGNVLCWLKLNKVKGETSNEQ